MMLVYEQGPTDVLRQLALEPQGFDSTASGLKPWTTYQIGQACERLRVQGELVKVKLSHKVVRFFGSQEHLNAWVKTRDLATGQKAAAASVTALSAIRARAPADWAGVEGAITNATVRTFGPNYTPRFQSVELGHIHSGCQRGRVLSTN
jgi:hypothetical protein